MMELLVDLILAALMLLAIYGVGRALRRVVPLTFSNRSAALAYALAFGLGVAMAQKQDGYDSRTFVVMGDGELNEGANWETILVAPAFKPGNLVVVVDRNRRQANMRTEDLIPLEDLQAKWKSFGWRTIVLGGHNVEQLRNALAAPPGPQTQPLVIIAETVRGKGISFLEDRKECWCYQLTDEEFEQACKEIEADV